MVRLNEMVVNGKSTDDLPFFCVVEVNDAPKKSIKKDKLYETDFSNGYSRQSVEAFKGYDKTYNFYLHNVEMTDIREFTTFISDTGWFTPSDDRDVKYIYEKSELEFDELDAVNGYVCNVTFTCQPFAMENEHTTDLGSRVFNHTNAPMYPFIEIRGKTGNPTYLQIGDQRMTFKEIQDVIFIECKHGYQDVYSSGGRKLNNETKGDFFEIQPGENTVMKGQGITSVKITERWGWR